MAIRSLNGVGIHVVDDPGAAGRRLADPHGVRARPHRPLGRLDRRPRLRARGASSSPSGGSDVHLWFGDERAVPPADERSNYRLVRETLLDRLRAQPTRAPHPRRARRAGGRRALRPGARRRHARPRAERDRRRRAHGVALPGRAGARRARSGARSPPRPGLEPFVERVTLTPPVFGSTRLLVYLVTGEAKAEAVRRAFAEEPSAGDAGEPDPRRRDDRDPRRRRRSRAPSGVAARPAAVGDERSEAMTVAGDEPVGSARRAPDRAVRPDDVGALVPRRLGKPCEQRLAPPRRRTAASA